MARASVREDRDSARAGQCGGLDSIRLGSLEVQIRRLGIEDCASATAKISTARTGTLGHHHRAGGGQRRGRLHRHLQRL